MVHDRMTVQFGSVVASVADPSLGGLVLVGSVGRPTRRLRLLGLPSGERVVAADTSSPWERRLFAVTGAVRQVSGPLWPTES